MSFSTDIFGLAAWYRMKRIFIPTPQRMPISSCSTKHAMNVPSPGMRSDSVARKGETINFRAGHIVNLSVNYEKRALLLFVLHIGLTTLTSTMKMTAAIMIAARVARGIKLKYGVRNSRAKITSKPGTQV